MMCPLFSTYSREAKVNAAEIFCSTTTMVWPASASARQVPSRSRTMIGARPSNGSSSRMSLRIAHQRARDRQHLLLAAREVGAAAATALAQARKHLPDPVQRPARRRGQPGQHEVFLDVEAAEDAALLGHQLHAQARRWRAAARAVRRRAVERHAAGARRAPRPSGFSASCSCRRRCGRAAPPPRSARPAARHRTGCG